MIVKYQRVLLCIYSLEYHIGGKHLIPRYQTCKYTYLLKDNKKTLFNKKIDRKGTRSYTLNVTIKGCLCLTNQYAFIVDMHQRLRKHVQDKTLKQ